jgi:general L-amino acid transport system substrate-binding protein
MQRLVLCAVSALLLAGPAFAGPTLDAVKKRGLLHCGVNVSLAGFSQPDAQGNWKGLDVDVCRAVAAAVLGDATKVKFLPYNTAQRFTALQSGEVEILSRNTTWTQARDTALGLNFAGVVYYDGQGFMVAKKTNVKSAKELKGATICVQSGTTTELNLADYFRANSLDFRPLVFQELAETEKAFFEGRCDAYTTDASGLASTRAAKATNPGDYAILPEIISKEPLGPAVRHGDDEWFDIVKWTINALLEAEESGVTQANVDQMKVSKDPTVLRLLGVTPGMGKNLGLDEDWAARAIKAVGNYGETFERNVGAGSNLKLERGLNAQWKKGGLMYAMPFR